MMIAISSRANLFWIVLIICLLLTFCTSLETAQETEEVVTVKIQETVTIPEPEEDTIYTTISAAVALGDIEAAIDAFEQAYSKDPHDPNTTVLYSNLLMAAGKLEEAREVLLSVINDLPENTDALYNLSLIEGIQGYEDKQVALLTAILQVNPEDPRALASMGEIFLKNKNTQQAKEAFERSLAGDGKNTVALMGYGNTLLREDAAAEAADVFSRVIEKDPSYLFAFVDRSRAKADLGDTAGAHDDLSAAIALDPEYYWNYIDRGKLRLLGLKDNLSALEDFNRAIELDPDYFYAYIYRGGIKDRQGNTTEAIGDFLKVIRQKPDYYYVYSPLAILLCIEERWNEARVYLEKAYAYEKAEHAYALLTALSYKSEDNEQAAEKYLKTAINSIPRDSLYYQVARLYMDPSYDVYATGEISKAEDRLMQTRMLYYLAYHYLLMGRTVLAQKYFLEVEDRDFPNILERRLASIKLDAYR